MAATFTFDHPTLGPMTGLIEPDNVVQFRAVPYATLPGRFQHSVPLENLDGTNRDFTKRGFASPHVFGLDVFVGGPYPGEDKMLTDEYQSFILQVNVPLDMLQNARGASSKLPVLIYLHGGGFVLGKVDAEHNTAPIVEQSIRDKQPVIGCSLQYRLGALGFIRTPQGETNFGLQDQRNALLWIQKFIDGFGGDHTRTTVFAESAGAMSICYQMLSAPPPSGPLFNRVILMSGIPGPQTRPFPGKEVDKMRKRLIDKLNLGEDTNVAFEKLRNLPVQEIVDASHAVTNEGGTWFPVHDLRWFREDLGSFEWDRIPEMLGMCEWVDDIVIGTTGVEASTMMQLAKALTPRTFREAIIEQLGEQAGTKLMKTYGVTDDMDQSLFLNAAISWVGDVVFEATTHALCRHLTQSTNKRVYRYIFDLRNPFPGHSLYQLPHHWVDIYYVFRTLQFRYPTQKLKRLSDKHASLWIDFANGNAPWSQWQYSGDGKEKIMVADERDGWVERTEAEDEEINERNWRRAEILWDSWSVKKGQRFLPYDLEPLKKLKLV